MANLLNKIFGSPIFTWWNSATFGTRLFTLLKGVKVGEDEQGNIYYKEKGGKKRWVIYKNGLVEASRVPADWHGWLHYTFDETPIEKPFKLNAWETGHQANQTGTKNAHAPKKAENSYEAWTP